MRGPGRHQGLAWISGAPMLPPMTPASPSWLAALQVAQAAAVAGGRAALVHFRSSDLAVDQKSNNTPVTRADRESEAAARAVIAAAFPQDGWIGEESEDHIAGTSGRRWIVDPVDGTRNFVRGIPLWSTLVACEQDTPQGPRVVASAVNLPALGELYDAVRGGGARCNGEAIRVSTIGALDQSLFCYETPMWFERFGLAKVFKRMCELTELQRGGGDAFYHMLVASGRAEVVVEPSLAIWDIAATSLIVDEAGGRWSTLDGRSDIRAGEAIITNGHLHDAVLAVVRRERTQSAR